MLSHTEKLELLLKCADKGLHIHPLRDWDAGAKECKFPRKTGWQQMTTTDAATIMNWLRWYPKANWGTATGAVSGVVVVDVDSSVDEETGLTGFDQLAELESIYGKLPKTWTVITGTDGRHFYFEHPGGYIQSKARLPQLGNARKIDIRADGGQAVVPPSINFEGKPYRWAEGCAPWETKLEPMPYWLLELIKNPPMLEYHRHTVEGYTPTGEKGELTWEEIDAYYANNPQAPAKRESAFWLYVACPIHGSNNQPSLHVAKQTGEYNGKHFDEGFFTCHSCNAKGYIVGTPGWIKWKKKKGSRDLSDLDSLCKYFANTSITDEAEDVGNLEESAFETFDLLAVTVEEKTQVDEAVDETWAECLRSIEEIERDNAYLRAYAQNYAQRFPDESDLFDLLLKVEKQITRAKKIEDVEMLMEEREELKAVYATIRLVYDEEQKRIEEERKKREYEEWTRFLSAVYVTQNDRGEPLIGGGLACWVNRCIGVVLPDVYHFLTETLREKAKACRKRNSQSAEEAFARALKAELDARLNQQIGDYVVVKYHQFDKDYYEVICTNEAKKKKRKKTNNLPSSATKGAYRRYIEEINKANAPLREFAEAHREQYPEFWGKIQQIEDLMKWYLPESANEGVDESNIQLDKKRIKELTTVTEGLLAVYAEIEQVFSETKANVQNREWEVFFESLRAFCDHYHKDKWMSAKDVWMICAVSPSADQPEKACVFPYPRFVMPKELRDAIERRRNSGNKEPLEAVFAAVLDDKLHQQYGEKKWSLIKDEQGRYCVVSMVSAEDMA